MKVLVYVEGESDRVSMKSLLDPLIQQKRQQGVQIDFFVSPAGHKKKNLWTKVPQKAVNIILNDPDAMVVVIPDLYPPNVAFTHSTAKELFEGIQRNFLEILHQKKVKDEKSFLPRLKVFCFKYDLEALLLAAEDERRKFLGMKSLKRQWTIPVEDQNHENPPKKIVEKLFQKSGNQYNQVIDAPLILKKCNYWDIAEACQQCFKPFVEFLECVP
ncbi:MAG: DUF4276 family protein [bacterium]